MQEEKQIFTHASYKLAYKDVGQGPAILFVHGTPTNSSEYDRVIELLSPSFRCLAMDHLGFGDSSKDPEADYSIEAHRQRLKAFLAHVGLKSFHLVVHDFGGVIGLPLVSEPQFKVQSVTVMNSWAWPLIQSEPQMKSQIWAVKSGLLPFLYRYLNFSAKFLFKLGWSPDKTLPSETHQKYISQFPNPQTRLGTVGFLRALFDFGGPYWNLEQELALMKTHRVQLIWGVKDRLISEKTLRVWIEKLPDAKVHRLESTGHFVAEEEPSTLAQLMRAMCSD